MINPQLSKLTTLSVTLLIALVAVALAVAGLPEPGTVRAAVGPTEPALAAQTPPGRVSLQATVGYTFTYQGRLEQDTGPVDGTCNLTFKLFDSLSGGSQVGGDVTNSSVVVQDGYFTQPLNFGGGMFDGSARWLEITINSCNGDSGSGGPLSPRVALSAAPYALYALDGPWGSSGSGGWNLTGNSGTSPGTHFLGTTDVTSLTLAVNNTPGLRLAPGGADGNNVPNVIGGSVSNVISDSKIGSVIGGGGNSNQPNRITADYATIGGGRGNLAAGPDATVSGGRGNQATQQYATVGGGNQNEASANYATVSGGIENTATGGKATVGGGYQNSATALNATVSGGENNSATAQVATVGGGYLNEASAPYTTIAGGRSNVITGTAGSAAIGGGRENVITGTANYANISGGHQNEASGSAATVGGGENNQATQQYATVGGGYNNQAAGEYATVDGGWGNQATGYNATVGGGYNNQSTADFATVPGGYGNIAQGDYSLAAGRQAQANHQGTFVWADSTDADFTSAVADEFAVRAGGGVRLETGGAGADLDGHAILTTHGEAHIIVEMTADPVVNGQNLRAAYAEAAALTPHGQPLAAGNRAVVLLPPGQYDLGTEGLTLDTEFVDLEGLSTDRDKQHLYGPANGPGTGVLMQTANNVILANLFVEITRTAGGVNTNANDPAAYFPEGDEAATVVRNCRFNTANQNRAWSMRIGIAYPGTYEEVRGYNRAFGGEGGTASGTFTDCTGGFEAFGGGGGGTASGTFTDCTGGDQAFGGWHGTASGTFTNCTGGDDAFGGRGGTASGTFADCTGGSYAFGGGGGGTASGTFTDCTGGSYAFGGWYGTASGTFTNCIGGDGAFGGGVVGDASGGVFRYCTGGMDSFTTNGSPAPVHLYTIQDGAVYP